MLMTLVILSSLVLGEKKYSFNSRPDVHLGMIASFPGIPKEGANLEKKDQNSLIRSIHFFFVKSINQFEDLARPAV